MLASGLELYSPDDESCSLVTAIAVPEGADADELRRAVLAAGYIIEGGRGRTAGKVLRFGHLGATDEDALNAGFDALLAALPRMSRPRCVVAEPIAEAGLALLREACDVVELEPGADLRRGPGRRGCAGRALGHARRRRADRGAPKLRVIGRAGVGVDNVDVAAATTAGIVVCNAPEANVVSAAEHALALLLALARHVSAAERSLRDGAWERERFAGIELADKTLALLGFGRIGRLVAFAGARARACAPSPTTRT